MGRSRAGQGWLAMAVLAAATVFVPGVGIRPAAASHGTCDPAPSGVGSEASISAFYPDATGALDVVAIFVDFDDAPAAAATPAALDDYLSLAEQAVAFHEARSYGRLDVRLEAVEQWLRMPRDNDGYGQLSGAFEDRAYVQDAVTLADPHVDFTGVDVVVVVPPANASALDNAVAPVFSGEPVVADDAEIRHASLMDDVMTTDGFGGLAHELGHNIGLPDTYLVDAVDDEDHPVAGWGIMGFFYGHSPDLFGWHKLLVGWLDSSDVACVTESGTTEVTLAPLAAADGTRLAVVPLDGEELVAVEYRDEDSPVGPDGRCSSGVLVYQVDQTVPSGEGPVRVHDAHPETTPPEEHCLALDDAAMAAGESTKVPGTGVEVAVESLGDTAVVRIVRKTAATVEPLEPFRRISGDSRVTTAVEVSRALYPQESTASAVVLARADGFADALAGTPLAAARNAPILLTPGDELPEAVQGEIYRILPGEGTVYVLGGESAISEDVVDTLRTIPLEGLRVERIGGATRYDTATLVARELGNPEDVLLASGRTFADAVTAGAAAVAVDGAILLTAGDEPVDVTTAYLTANPGGQHWAIGGPAARAHPDATPIVGSDRYATSAAVADAFFDGPHHVGLARGDDFPDSLAGGALLGSRGGPVLLTPVASLASPTRAHLCLHVPEDALLFAFGGPAALAPATLEEAVAAMTKMDCPRT